MTGVMTRRVGQSMAEQLDRVNKRAAATDTHEIMRLQRELEAARQRIADLERENDALAARCANRPASDRPQVGGREVVNQAEAARRLHVNQSQISRWVAAGHFSTTPYGKRTLIFADTLHRPTPKKRTKKRSS